jgi:hypothetical protein
VTGLLSGVASSIGSLWVSPQNKNLGHPDHLAQVYIRKLSCLHRFSHL